MRRVGFVLCIFIALLAFSDAVMGFEGGEDPMVSSRRTPDLKLCFTGIVDGDEASLEEIPPEALELVAAKGKASYESGLSSSGKIILWDEVVDLKATKIEPVDLSRSVVTIGANMLTIHSN